MQSLTVSNQGLYAKISGITVVPGAIASFSNKFSQVYGIVGQPVMLKVTNVKDAYGNRISGIVSVIQTNTDLAKSIRVMSAQYYDTDGKKLRNYVPTAQAIPPMGTLELFVPRSDDTGGSGANFIIVWKADQAASPPIVEGIHANMPTGRAIAFISSARTLPED